MNTTITIPKEVKFLLDQLHQHGWEAYVVGGCVRDSLLGKSPDDWDITTSALPLQTKEALPGIPVLDTGLQHGTVTAVLNKKPFEITTYRTDGVYTDHRRPDQVTFTRSLQEDLARRDFTINALAYHPEQGLLDYFGGLEDFARTFCAVLAFRHSDSKRTLCVFSGLYGSHPRWGFPWKQQPHKQLCSKSPCCTMSQRSACKRS